MENRGFLRAKWTLGIAAACVAALGLFSCSGGDVTGITALSAAYDIVYEFDRRTGSDGIDNDGDGLIDGADTKEDCMDTCLDTDRNGICEGEACGDCDDCDDCADLVGGGPATNCTNDIDDDGDLLIDEADCINDIDDDGDTFTDETNCTDDIDNDGDTLINETNCTDGIDNDGDSSIDEKAVPIPCPTPAPSSNEFRLELAHFDGAVARFVLRAYEFSIDNASRIRFGLAFNGDLLRYIYPSPGVEPHDRDYPGAVPWEKLPPTLEPKPGKYEGLADYLCNGCCIEWTDYSCTGPGKKGDECFQDINPNDVKLCIKRSCTPSGSPSGPNHSCVDVSAQDPPATPRVDCCDCGDVDPISRQCRRTVSVPACTESGKGCHNTCDQPLFTELEGDVANNANQVHICCTADALLQVEDPECEAMALKIGAPIDFPPAGSGPPGVEPMGVVATIPLWVKAAREFDDFRLSFQLGENAVHPYHSKTIIPAGGAAFITGKGTVIATK